MADFAFGKDFVVIKEEIKPPPFRKSAKKVGTFREFHWEWAIRVK